MADSFEAGREKSREAVPAVPSSASEVSIRTMQTDLELMGRSGGMASPNMAQVTRVELPPDTVRTNSLGLPITPVPNMPGETERPSIHWGIWALIALAVGSVLFALGFYIAPLVLK